MRRTYLNFVVVVEPHLDTNSSLIASRDGATRVSHNTVPLGPLEIYRQAHAPHAHAVHTHAVVAVATVDAKGALAG